MKKLFAAALLLCLSAIGAQAQLTAAKAFVDAPASVFPLVDNTTRLDMIDYVNAGMSTQSVNRLGGGSAIIELTPMKLRAKMTDASIDELFLLPAGSDTIIGVIRTVATPGHDSSISFFNSSWQPLKPGAVFTAPVLADWVTDQSHIPDVETVVPFMLVGYSYDPDKGVLTATNNLEPFLSKDIYSIVAPFMTDTIVYQWNGKRFKAGL